MLKKPRIVRTYQHDPVATKKKREVEVERYLKKVTERHSGQYRKWVSPGRRGVPDDVLIVPCFDPCVVFVEAKAPGETSEDHQLREHERLEKAGGTVHVVDDYDQVDDLFFLLCNNSEHDQ